MITRPAALVARTTRTKTLASAEPSAKRTNEEEAARYRFGRLDRVDNEQYKGHETSSEICSN